MIKCPDRCSGGDPGRQYSLTDGQFKRLSESAQDAVKKSSGQVCRCSYCGCIYFIELHGARKLGILDGDVTGDGWVPYHFG